MNGFAYGLAWSTARKLPQVSSEFLPGMTPHDSSRRVGAPILVLDSTAPHFDQVQRLALRVARLEDDGVIITKVGR